MSTVITKATTQSIITITCVDGEEHAEGCEFVHHAGVLACNCDATRTTMTWWWKCWLQWNKVRVQDQSHIHYRNVPGTSFSQLPWPVQGADFTPWIPGRDFNDAPLEG